MKLGIFCFYDADGIVSDYVVSYLETLSDCIDVVDVIVNGSVDAPGRQKLERFARKLYIRENTGFDAGAYTEYLTAWSSEKELASYDTVFFLNDTVFGPFVPLPDILDAMEKKQVDFWGIREASRGAFSYLESWFLAFGRRVLRSGDLTSFFREHAFLKTASYQEVLSCFERGLFSFLRRKGYTFASYCDLPYYDIFYSSDYCITKGGYPFLKKKCLDIYTYGQLQLDIIMEFVEKSDYDEKLILSYMRDRLNRVYQKRSYTDKQYREKLDSIVHLPRFETGEEEILRFLREHEEVYIYGAGYHAGTFYCIFHPFMKRFRGFVVSRQVEEGRRFWEHPVISREELPQDAAVLVALDRKNTGEVRTLLGENERILYLWK